MPTKTAERRAIQYSTTLTPISCGECGIPFAIPEAILADLQATGRNFHCPNGHRICYHETENDRLKREAAEARQQRDHARKAFDRESDRATAAERSATAYKGHATRLRNRVGRGKCPCCHQTFQQLATHMQRKHPGYAGDDG